MDYKEIQIRKGRSGLSLLRHDVAENERMLELVIILMAGFVPSPDGDFDMWQKNFITVAGGGIGGWGIAGATFKPLTDTQAKWDPAWLAGNPLADPNKKQTNAKTTMRKSYEKIIRTFIQKFIRRNDLITNDELVSMGIPPLAAGKSDTPAPDYTPDGSIKEIKYLSHVLELLNPTTPNSRALGEGIGLIRVMRFVSLDPPITLSQFGTAGNAKRAKFISKFVIEDLGKTAWYVPIYESTSGDVGDPGKMFSEVIA